MQVSVDASYYAQAEESITDKVVYLLGAGFSAPLGLPVMSNFLVKSKDMYFANTERFGGFKEVFDTINEMSVSKNYYDADLFNIEEILSILEMQELVGRGRLKKDFVQYIINVIKFFTPSLQNRKGNLSSNWHGTLFSRGQFQREYGYFVANLLGLQFEKRPDSAGGASYVKLPRPTTSYSVITLNYDMVLESYVEYVERNHARKYDNDEEGLDFYFGSEPGHARPRSVPLAKLHGSVDTGVVVPPTWNKALNQNLLPSWKLASKLLSEANHIRVIGYSLPAADAYVKYLLKAAAVHTPHLKSIDVLCLDGTGEVRQRYERFVQFDRFRFVSGSVLDYLGLNYDLHRSSYPGSAVAPNAVILEMNKLETAHEQFFGR